MDNKTKEVYFSGYCQSCEHKSVSESDEPCNECLAQGYNLNSHRPVYYKEVTGGSLTNE